MNILKETIQNDSEVASLIRSNIPFIAQMISEQRLGIFGRVARFGQELGYRGLEVAAKVAQRGLQRKTDYQRNVANKWETEKTAEKVGTSASRLRSAREDYARLGGRRPIAPGPGATSADVARFHANMEAWRLGKSLETRTASEKAKDPIYRNTVSTIERQNIKNDQQIAGRNPNWTGTGSPIRLRNIGLGGLYKSAAETEKEARDTADALRRDRQTDVMRHRAAARNVARAKGLNPDSAWNRLKIGLLRPRI